MRKMRIQTAAALLSAAVVFAQAPADPRPAGGTIGGIIGWSTAEAGPRGGAIKASPYSATIVNESVQMLADGNRIHRETTSSVYRDSEGRTRNETQAAGVPQLITINDPVAGMSYVLNPDEKTARKMPAMLGVAVRGVGTVGAVGATLAPAGIAVPSQRMIYPADQRSEQMKTEQLGTKMFDAVQAEGTRATYIIPAGVIGNERQIEVVTERWFSAQLQTEVMTVHSDPRTGTNTYRLTGINLAEPDRSLFEVPAGYKIIDSGMMIPRRIAAPAREP
jgi:hypothetical protein